MQAPRARPRPGGSLTLWGPAGRPSSRPRMYEDPEHPLTDSGEGSEPACGGPGQRKVLPGGRVGIRTADRWGRARAGGREPGSRPGWGTGEGAGGRAVSKLCCLRLGDSVVPTAERTLPARAERAHQGQTRGPGRPQSHCLAFLLIRSCVRFARVLTSNEGNHAPLAERPLLTPDAAGPTGKRHTRPRGSERTLRRFLKSTAVNAATSSTRGPLQNRVEGPGLGRVRSAQQSPNLLHAG